MLALRLTAAAAAAAAVVVGTRVEWLWRLRVVLTRRTKRLGVVVDVDWEG